MRDVIKGEYLRYLKLKKQSQGPFSFEKKSKPRVGEIRIFGIFPPIYFLIAEKSFAFGNGKREKNIYKVLPLSEELILSHLTDNTPIFVFKDLILCLAVLPFWIYLTEEILFEYSKKIAETDFESIEKCIKYAENTEIPQNYQGKFIRSEMERLSQFNTSSIFDFVSTLEEVEQKTSLDFKVTERMEEEHSYKLAATPKKVLKGKNWYGIIEESKDKNALILYLPYFAIGKKIIIRIKDDIIFEGKIESDKLIIENLPSLPDYSFLEEELNVQI